jgi:arabinose-5-phosphate isomerase
VFGSKYIVAKGIAIIMDIIKEAKRVFDIEIEALQKTRDSIDVIFAEIMKLITSCEGKVIITGIGKPGHIARKIAATLASLGTPAFYLHPAEALHGDLGMICESDVVIVVSYSGESDEIIRILPNIKMIGAKIIAISGNADSTLVRYSNISQILPEFREACHLGLAPTSSTTVSLVYGDALAVVASIAYGFKEYNYALYHPAGSLGKKLIIKVSDVMKTGKDNSVIYSNASVKEAIIELSKKALGIVTIVDDSNKILGVITDGDLRRALEKGINVYDLTVNELMTKNPFSASAEMMAVEALKRLKEKNISSMPVKNNLEELIGTIGFQAIINSGIIA